MPTLSLVLKLFNRSENRLISIIIGVFNSIIKKTSLFPPAWRDVLPSSLASLSLSKSCEAKFLELVLELAVAVEALN